MIHATKSQMSKKSKPYPIMRGRIPQAKIWPFWY
eukprot:03856.XXX_1831_1932_1 [CDS] Oithona nana genome sequencing.